MCNNHYQRHRTGWQRADFRDQPPVNIEETDESFILRLYAPALSKENITVQTRNDSLIIQLKKEQSEETTPRFTRREYNPGDTERVFGLRGKVVVEEIKAAYTEGILKIDLPKNEAAKKPAAAVPVG